MAQTTTNYGLLKPEATDSYNHLIYDNPNMDTIDAAMKANSDAAITSATCIKSGTTHTITRSNTSASVMRFTATGDWNSGDTMIIDGVTVSPFLMTGEALKTGAYLINSEVIIALSGTRATVLTNQSEAGTTYFDDSNVSFTANNVEDAIEELEDAKIKLFHTERITITGETINGNEAKNYALNDITGFKPVFARAEFGVINTVNANVILKTDTGIYYTQIYNTYSGTLTLNGSVVVYYVSDNAINN